MINFMPFKLSFILLFLIIKVMFKILQARL